MQSHALTQPRRHRSAVRGRSAVRVAFICVVGLISLRAIGHAQEGTGELSEPYDHNEITVVKEGMGSFRVEAYAIHDLDQGVDEYHYTLTNVDYCGGISYFSIDMGGNEASGFRSSEGWPTAIEGDRWVWEGRPGIQPGESAEFIVVLKGPRDSKGGFGDLWALPPCPSLMAHFATIIPGDLLEDSEDEDVEAAMPGAEDGTAPGLEIYSQDEITVVEEGMGSFRVEAYAIHDLDQGVDEYRYTLTNVDYCGGISYFSIDMGGDQAREVRSSRGWGTKIEGEGWVWEGAPAVEQGESAQFAVVLDGPRSSARGGGGAWARPPCPGRMARFETIIPGGLAVAVEGEDEATGESTAVAAEQIATDEPLVAEPYLDETVLVSSDDGSVNIKVTAWHDEDTGTDTYQYAVTNVDHCGVYTFSVDHNGNRATSFGVTPGWDPSREEERWLWDSAKDTQILPGETAVFSVTVAGHRTPNLARVSIFSLPGCILGKQDVLAPTPGDTIRIVRAEKEGPPSQSAYALIRDAAETANDVRPCCRSGVCEDLAWQDCRTLGGVPGSQGEACATAGCGRADLGIVISDIRHTASSEGKAVFEVLVTVTNQGEAGTPGGVPVVVEMLLASGLWLAADVIGYAPGIDPGGSWSATLPLHVSLARLPGEESLIACARVNPLHFAPAFDFELTYTNNTVLALCEQ